MYQLFHFFWYHSLAVPVRRPSWHGRSRGLAIGIIRDILALRRRLSSLILKPRKQRHLVLRWPTFLAGSSN